MANPATFSHAQHLPCHHRCPPATATALSLPTLTPTTHPQRLTYHASPLPFLQGMSTASLIFCCGMLISDRGPPGTTNAAAATYRWISTILLSILKTSSFDNAAYLHASNLPQTDYLTHCLRRKAGRSYTEEEGRKTGPWRRACLAPTRALVACLWRHGRCDMAASLPLLLLPSSSCLSQRLLGMGLPGTLPASGGHGFDRQAELWQAAGLSGIAPSW